MRLPFLLAEMKEFFTYEQQLERLESRGLIIPDREKAYGYLKFEGYYNLINGYAHFFEEYGKKEQYMPGTTLENILQLYIYDKTLRNIVYKYTATIECHIKALVAHEFSKNHGVDQKTYLSSDSFTRDSSCAPSIARLIEECKQTIADACNKDSNKYRQYIAHNLEAHGHVPMWILIRALSFGTTSIFYKFMQPSEKASIASEYGLTAEQLTNMLEVVVSFRNIVAHGERTFCAKMPKTRLSTNLKIAKNLGIPLNQKGVPKYGRSDFLALIICFKYLLPAVEFSGFIYELEMAMEEFKKKVNGMIVQRVSVHMGIYGTNWKNLVKMNK